MAMPFQLTPLELAEAILIACGGVLILSAVARWTVRRRWREVLALPAPPAHGLGAIDALAAAFAFIVLPSSLVAMIQPFAGPATGSDAAARPGPAPADPVNIVALAVGIAAATVVMVLIARVRCRDGLRGWGLTWDRPMTRLGRAVALYLFVWPICFGLLHLAVFLIRQAQPDFEPPEHATILTLMSDQTTAWMRAVTVFTTVILSPLSEELLLRGLVLVAVARWAGSAWWGVLASSVLFGALHYSLPHTIPTLTALGLLLGYVYAKTNSLTLTVLVHAVFNAKTLLWLALSADQ